MTDSDSIYNNKNNTNLKISNFKSVLLNKDSVKYSPSIFTKKIFFYRVNKFLNPYLKVLK